MSDPKAKQKVYKLINNLIKQESKAVKLLQHSPPVCSGGLSFSYKTFEDYVRGYANALTSESWDEHAIFVVQNIDYLANPSI